MFLIDPYRFAAAAAYDTDAQAYITAVETADGQALETGVRDAINAFVVGCKADNIWTAIKASCILAGARTLAGALVPLVGPAPTNEGPFVSGDYDRKTGLVGNGATKYLNSNYAISSTLSSNTHVSVFVSTVPTVQSSLIEVVQSSTGTGIFRDTNATVYYSCWTPSNYGGPSLASGTLAGVSRDNATTMVVRSGNTSQTQTRAVAATLPPSHTPYVFARNSNGNPAYRTNARLPFYSIGESLNLALLDSRVSTLISALATAIP